MENKLVELVNLWHAYETENKHASIEDFARLYLAKQQKSPIVLNHGFKTDKIFNELPPISQLGKLFGRMTRFGQTYYKKALSHLEISAPYEYEFLLILENHESLKKSDLINIGVADFTTGIEVIKRLLKNNYVTEFPDPDDKRSKRLKITSLGRSVIEKAIGQMQKLGPISFGILSEDEIMIMLQILKKLDIHHTENIKENRNLDFDVIVERTKIRNSSI